MTHTENDPKRVVSAHEEVIVVPDDHISTKNTIRMTESLISHANNHHGQDIDFNIAPSPSSKRAVEASCGFHMSLERTPRMPDDNKLHQLPGSLGSYDLFSVEAYADRLPKNITETGGVFFPMLQREAMWLNFGPTNQQCAVRVFMGHVNTISGLTMEETADNESGEREQDYIVVPGQEWLDGICVAPGVVRQFVAMPRTFSIQSPKVSTNRMKWVPATLSKARRHRKNNTGVSSSKSRLRSCPTCVCGRTANTNISSDRALVLVSISQRIRRRNSWVSKLVMC